MPKLHNAKHELFAQGLAKGMSQADAYGFAGYKPSEPHASRLARNGKVRDRVAELQEKVAIRAEWTAADRLKMLSDIAKEAIGKDPRVAVSAIAEANKMQGSHAPSQLRHSGPNGGAIPLIDLSKATEDQLEALEALIGPLAGSSGDDAEPDPG